MRKIRPETKAQLAQAESAFRQIADQLALVREGYPLTEIAKKLNLTPQELNTNIHKFFAPYVKKFVMDEKMARSFIEATMSPEERVFRAAFELEKYIFDKVEFSEEGIESWMHNTLSAKEYEVLYLIYFENMTLEEAGKELGVTRERVRQIRVEALRKMRHPSRLKELYPELFEQIDEESKRRSYLLERKNNLVRNIDRKLGELEAANRSTEEVISTLESIFDKLSLDDDSVSSKSIKTSVEDRVRMAATRCYYEEGRYPDSIEYLEERYGLEYDKDAIFVTYFIPGPNMLPEIKATPRSESEAAFVETWAGRTIREAELSVRAFTCLTRSRLVGVADLLYLEEVEDAMHIRNLGPKSLFEVAEFMAEICMPMDWIYKYLGREKPNDPVSAAKQKLWLQVKKELAEKNAKTWYCGVLMSELKEVKFNVMCNAVYKSKLKVPDEIANDEEALLGYIHEHLYEANVGDLTWISDYPTDVAVTAEDIVSL